MANGPLAYESTPEVQSNGNGTETSSSLASEDDTTFFSNLQIAAHIPQMKLPPSYASTFQLILGGAVTVAVLFPLFTRRAIRRAREGKMGLGEDGRKAKMCSKEGLYMLSKHYQQYIFFWCYGNTGIRLCLRI